MTYKDLKKLFARLYFRKLYTAEELLLIADILEQSEDDGIPVFETMKNLIPVAFNDNIIKLLKSKI